VRYQRVNFSISLDQTFVSSGISKFVISSTRWYQ
jgi:hypothetical protein